jgi:DNA-binding NarL/FixJ family response regulator
MNSPLITVAIVEDNAGMRSSLEKIIRSDVAFKLLASFPDAESAIRDLPNLCPRVVLMDINLPGMSGVEGVGLLVKKLPDVQIIMLTVYEDTDVIFQSLAAGASGYLLKPVRAAQLLASIHDVVAGGAPMSSNIARRVVQAFRKSPATENHELEQLSPREREILDMLACGLLQKEIAQKLSVSYWTVQTHIGRIYEKLHVHSRAQAVARLQRK